MSYWNRYALAVDDDPQCVNTLRLMLRFCGFHHIVTAEDGFVALEYLKEWRFDLVVSDWNMAYHGWHRAADAGSPRSFHGQRTVYSRDGEPDRTPVARSYRAWGDRVPLETLHAGGAALGVSALSGAEGVRRGQRDAFESASERSVATKIVPHLRDKPAPFSERRADFANWLLRSVPWFLSLTPARRLGDALDARGFEGGAQIDFLPGEKVRRRLAIFGGRNEPYGNRRPSVKFVRKWQICRKRTKPPPNCVRRHREVAARPIAGARVPCGIALRSFQASIGYRMTQRLKNRLATT